MHGAYIHSSFMLCTRYILYTVLVLSYVKLSTFFRPIVKVIHTTRSRYTYFEVYNDIFPSRLLSSPFYSLSLLVATIQIRGHIAGSCPPLPTTVRALHFLPEKISAPCPSSKDTSYSNNLNIAVISICQPMSKGRTSGEFPVTLLCVPGVYLNILIIIFVFVFLAFILDFNIFS